MNITVLNEKYVDIIHDWFEKTKLNQVIEYAVYAKHPYRINNTMDIGNIVLTKEDEQIVSELEGHPNCPDLRIYFDEQALDFLDRASSPAVNLVALSIERVLEGISYNYEKGKISIAKPNVSEHYGVLSNYGLDNVVEVYRAAIEQYQTNEQ